MGFRKPEPMSHHTADPEAGVAAHTQGLSPPPSNTGLVWVLLPDTESGALVFQPSGTVLLACWHLSCHLPPPGHTGGGSGMGGPQPGTHHVCSLQAPRATW